MNNCHIFLNTMKITRCLFLFFVLYVTLFSGAALAQTSLKDIDLPYGSYQVGFQHYTLSDSSRTYSRIYDYTNSKIARPIPISLWYPATNSTAKESTLTVLDYFSILKEEEEWEHLPDEQLLNWFYYANTDANQQHLREQSTAIAELTPLKGPFPVVVYTPSFQASSIENFALCELLASHGYVVIASPSRGTVTRWFQKPDREMETQARDVEFLIREVASFPSADPNQIALMGFSFGGLANTVVAMRNDRVKTVVSLDGSERYQYSLLQKSPFFDFTALRIPYLHMAQKDIPDEVLKADQIDPALNSQFLLYDSLTQSKAYQMKFHDLSHTHFATLGVLFANRDSRQDKSDIAIMQSYSLMATYALQFLKTHLQQSNDKAQGVGPMDKDFANDAPTALVSIQHKTPTPTSFSTRDFNDLAAAQQYQELSALYQTISQAHPGVKLPEGELNKLGLQLVFNPNTGPQGIKVLQFAVEQYPNSANLFDSLAEAYLFLGKRTEAIRCFKKSLQLYSGNDNAKNRLKQLTGQK